MIRKRAAKRKLNPDGRGRVKRRGASPAGKVPEACHPTWTRRKLSGRVVRFGGRDEMGSRRVFALPVEACEILADNGARLADIRWARMQLVLAWHGSQDAMAKAVGVSTAHLRTVITGVVFQHVMQERLDLEYSKVYRYIRNR